jgi:prevent-host-death family protein
MKVVNMHEAKTQLSKLVDRAARGAGFIIAKAGKPMVKVVPLDTPEPAEAKRIGFLAGQIEVPEDFDSMNARVIERLFNDPE